MFVYKLLNSKPLGPWVCSGIRDARSDPLLRNASVHATSGRAYAFPTYRRLLKWPVSSGDTTLLLPGLVSRPLVN